MDQTITNVIEKYLQDVKDRKYWLIRTYSGEYYNEFKNHNFVGIGWNEIKLSDIDKIHFDTPNKLLKTKRKDLIDELATKIEFPESKDFASEESKMAVGVRTIHQIETFLYEVKKGDIVLIPSKNSDYYSFGEIEMTPAYVADSFERANTNCDLFKRKKVRWIKFDIPRHRLDPNYLNFLRVQSTINDISEYQYFIEKTISKSFIIGELSYFVFNVTKSEDLNPSHYKAILQLIDLTEQFIFEESEIRINEVDIKARVQSNGEFVIVSDFLPYIFCFAITVIGLLGGGLSIEKLGLKLGTKGLFGSIINSKNNKAMRTEYEKNQRQARKNNETIRKAIELNPNLIKDCNEIVAKLMDGPLDTGFIKKDSDIV